MTWVVPFQRMESSVSRDSPAGVSQCRKSCWMWDAAQDRGCRCPYASRAATPARGGSHRGRRACRLPPPPPRPVPLLPLRRMAGGERAAAPLRQLLKPPLMRMPPAFLVAADPSGPSHWSRGFSEAACLVQCFSYNLAAGYINKAGMSGGHKGRWPGIGCQPASL